MSEFTAKTEAFNSLLKSSCDAFIFINKGEHQTAVGIKGSTPDLLQMMNSAYRAIREELEKRFGDKAAEEMMKTITYDEAQIERELETLKKKNASHSKEMPKWLRKLMELEKEDEDEDEDDDPVNETECEEEDEEDDDDFGDSSDISVRVDLHVHDSDDDRK